MSKFYTFLAAAIISSGAYSGAAASDIVKDHEDECYNLCIAKYHNSGACAKLCRHLADLETEQRRSAQ